MMKEPRAQTLTISPGSTATLPDALPALLAQLQRIAEELAAVKEMVTCLVASPAEEAPPQSIRTEHPHIVRTEGVCGGRSRIVGHRITVQALASLYRDGETVEGMVETYPHLTRAEICDALSYYYDHRAEIDRQIEEDDRFYEQAYAEHRAQVGPEEHKSIRERFDIPPEQWPYPDVEAELARLERTASE